MPGISEQYQMDNSVGILYTKLKEYDYNKIIPLYFFTLGDCPDFKDVL